MNTIMNPLSRCFVRPYRAIGTAAWTNPTNLLAHHEPLMRSIMNPLSRCFVHPYRAIGTAAWTNPTNLLSHHEPLMTGFMNPLSRCFVHPQIHQGSDLVFCPTAKISLISFRHEGFHEGFHEPSPSWWSI